MVSSCIVIKVLSSSVYVSPLMLALFEDWSVIPELFREEISTVSSNTNVNSSSVRLM